MSSWRIGPSELVVVADRGGDPLVVSSTDHLVRVASHGRGTWHFEVLVDDLAAVLVALGTTGRIVQDVGHLDLTDQDGLVRADHLRSATTDLTGYLGEDTARHLLRWLEWSPEH